MDSTGLICPVCGSELIEDAVYCPYCGQKLEGADECDDYAYEAFISYRHLPDDRKAALMVQRTLESFSIPAPLQASAGKKRLGKCFRDEDELPTSSSLTAQIRDALRRSRFFVVVCSPQTRESLWVQKEILLFASYHGRDKIFVAIASGESSECFPELLLTYMVLRSGGAVQRVKAEPIAADLRSASRSKRRQECLRIAAPLIGCGYDDLRQRMRARRARAVSAIASGIAVVSIAFGAFAAYQQIQIAESYRQMQIEESEFLAKEAGELLDQGDRYEAIQVALAALPESSMSNDRPFVPAAQLALEEALQVWPSPNRWLPCYSKGNLAHEETVFNDAGLMASLRADRMVEIAEVASGDIVCVINARQLLDYASFDRDYISEKIGFAGDKLVYRCSSGLIGCFDARSGALLWKADLGSVYSIDSIVVSRDGSMIAVATEPGSSDEIAPVYILSTSDGREVQTISLPSSTQLGMGYSPFSIPEIAFSSDGTHLAVGRWGYLFEADLAKGKYQQSKLQHEAVLSVEYSSVPKRIFVVTTDSPLGSLTGGAKGTLEAFDGSLKRLWAHTDQFDYHFSKYGFEYDSLLKPFGWWNYYHNDSYQLVVVSGCNLLLLDDKTGEEIFRFAVKAPILDCLISSSIGGARIYLSTADGTLMYRSPVEDKGLVNGSLLDTSTFELAHSKFFEVDGRVYVSLRPLDSAKQVLYRYAGFSEIEGAELIESSLKDAAFVWGFDYIGGVTDTAAVIWDGNTFEELARWDFADLDKLEPVDTRDNVSILYDGLANKLVLCGQRKVEDENDSNKGIAVYIFDAESKSLVADYVIEGVNWPDSENSISYANYSGQMLLLAQGYQNVLVFDAEIPSDPIIQIQRNRYMTIRKAWLTGEAVILFEREYVNNTDDIEGEFVYQMELVDIGSGVSIDSDLCRYIPQSANAERFAALSPDGGCLAMVCDDGMTRLFDTKSGNLIWETIDAPLDTRSISMVLGEDVLLQDGDGRLIQLSGDDGHVKRVSSTMLGTITGCGVWDDHTIIAFYEIEGTNNHTGITCIPIDAESLDPISNIYCGLCLSSDGSSAIAYNSSTREAYQYQRHSLDDLIAMAHETIEGHELTDTERYLYRID